MTGTTRRMRPQRGRELAVAALAAACVLAAACGKKGNPLPPMRIIPNATTDLKVAQRGNQLVLRFAYPQTTTAGAKLPGLAAVEVWDLVRPLPANSKQYPLVDPKEFAGAKRIASLTGPELQSSIEGGQVVLRLPLPAIEAPPAPTPTRHPPPRRRPLPHRRRRHRQPRPRARRRRRALRRLPARRRLLPPRLGRWRRPSPARCLRPRAAAARVRRQDGRQGRRDLRLLQPRACCCRSQRRRRRPASASSRAPTASRCRGGPMVRASPASPSTGGRRRAAATASRSPRCLRRPASTSTPPPLRRALHLYRHRHRRHEPRVESAFGEEREVDYEDRFPPAPPEDLVALPQRGAVSLVWQGALTATRWATSSTGRTPAPTSASSPPRPLPSSSTPTPA